MIKTYIETRYIKPMSEHYFFVEDLSGEENTLSIVKNNNAAPTVTVEYSTDEQNWQTLGSTSRTALTYNIPANGRVYLRANNNTFGYNNISANKIHNIGGNLLSLLYGVNFIGQNAFPGGREHFRATFQNNVLLQSAAELVIPVLTTGGNDSLTSTFEGCTSLITTPDLSTITTSGGSWGLYCTFYKCTSLTSVDLPNLTTTGLYYTFAECTSLTSVDLSSITINNARLDNCFEKCTSLSSVNISGITTWTTSTNNWLNNVAATGTIYINSAIDGVIPENSTSGIPSGWTKVVL